MNEIKRLYALEWFGPYESIEDYGTMMILNHVLYISLQEKKRMKEERCTLNMSVLQNEILQIDYLTKII